MALLIESAVKAGRSGLARAGCRHRLGQSRSQIRFCVKRHSSDGTREAGEGGEGDIGCRSEQVISRQGENTGGKLGECDLAKSRSICYF